MTFADVDGRECVPCPAGAYSAVGSTQCIQCPAYVNSANDGCTPHCAKGEIVDETNKRCIANQPVVPPSNDNTTNNTNNSNQTDPDN